MLLVTVTFQVSFLKPFLVACHWRIVRHFARVPAHWLGYIVVPRTWINTVSGLLTGVQQPGLDVRQTAALGAASGSSGRRDHGANVWGYARWANRGSGGGGWAGKCLGFGAEHNAVAWSTSIFALAACLGNLSSRPGTDRYGIFSIGDRRVTRRLVARLVVLASEISLL